MSEQSRSEDRKVQELVAMLDQLMGQGGGHVTDEQKHRLRRG